MVYCEKLHFLTVNKLSFGRFLLRCFRDPIRVPRIENRVPRTSENYHRVPRIREIGSLQVYTGYPTFSLKKRAFGINFLLLLHRGFLEFFGTNFSPQSFQKLLKLV